MFSVMMIGCGKIAGKNKNSHARAIHANRNLDLKVCVDTNKDKADYFAKEFNCISYTDLNKALSKEKVNIISICSPDHTHYEITKNILNSVNKPDLIFLEKPICHNLNEYYFLLKLSNTNNIPIVVNHSRRFNSDFIHIKNLIHKNYFGDLLRISATYYNGFIHNGTHIIDTIIFLFKESITFNNANNPNFCSYKKDKTFDIYGETDISRVPLDIKAIDERYYQIFEFDFWFSNARLRIEDFGDSLIFECPKTNYLNESVLIKKKLSLKSKKYSEIEFAYNEICRSLIKKRPEILDNFTLQNSEFTIKAISQAMDLLK